MQIEESSLKIKNAYNSFLEVAKKINARHNNPNLIFSSIYAEVYEKQTPIFACASIIAIDNITYKVVPYDNQNIKHIVAGLESANRGFSLVNNGDHIIVKLPPLTVERRKLLAKELKQKSEAAKIKLRQIRHNEFKNQENKNLSEDQLKGFKKKLTDIVKKYTEELDEFVEKKTQSLLND